MSTARNHHWISQSYLARFTEKGNKRSKLFVVDMTQRRTYQTRPRNVCAQRDFNKIESPDLPSDALETSLSQFETMADQAIAEVITNTHGYSIRSWHVVLNFMALLATRNPPMRSRADRIYRDKVLEDLEGATDTPEKFAALVAAAQAAGNLDSNLVADYERHREFLAGRRFNLTFHPAFHVLGEFKALDVLLQQLGTRRWLLVEAPADSGGFITTDRPVTLCHSDGSMPTPDRPLAYTTPDTMVLFPLSPKLLAMGTLGGRAGAAKGNSRLVPIVNCKMLQHCDKQLFAPHGHFKVLVPQVSHYIVGVEVLGLFERIEVEPVGS